MFLWHEIMAKTFEEIFKNNDNDLFLTQTLPMMWNKNSTPGEHGADINYPLS